MFRFSVVTFGCRVNQADSFDCEREMREAGGVAVGADEADLVLVNTCSVTAAADQAARNAIRRIARRNPSARIIATGCYATRNPADLEHLPGVVRLVPNDEKERLAAILQQSPAKAGLHIARMEPDSSSSVSSARSSSSSSFSWNPASAGFHSDASFFRPGDRGRTAFPLRVQTGCDEACSYCAIPASRGPSRSAPVDDVLAEATRLAEAGYRELILTGVHLGAFGRDLHPRSSLLALLEALDHVAGDFRLRISSLEPMDCPREVIELVARSPRFARHFHFPLQHASDRLLVAMRRPYRLADYQALVGLTRTALPDAAIGCDVIVGFPGETSADHEELRRFLSSSPVTHLHVFPYSDRPGTQASSMSGKLDARVVAGRCAELRRVSDALKKSFAGTQVGQVRPAITIEDGSRAITDNYLQVAIRPGRRRNERVDVRILSVDPLRGEVLS